MELFHNSKDSKSFSSRKKIERKGRGEGPKKIFSKSLNKFIGSETLGKTKSLSFLCVFVFFFYG